MKRKRRYRDSVAALCVTLGQFGFGAGCQSSETSDSQEEADREGSGGASFGGASGGAMTGGSSSGGNPGSCQRPPVIVEDAPSSACGGSWLTLVQGDDAPIPFNCAPIDGEQACACFLTQMPGELDESDLLVLSTGGTPRNAELARLEFDEDCPGYESRRIDYETLYGDCAWLRPVELVVRVPGGASGSSCDYTMAAILEDGPEEMACSASSGTCLCRVLGHYETEIVRFELMEETQLIDTWIPPFHFAPEREGECPEPEYGDWGAVGMGGMGGDRGM